jgi:hypothetical protein
VGTEVFWLLMTKSGDDDNLFGVTQVLEVMEKTRFDVKHLAFLYCKLQELRFAIENVGKDAAFKHIA